MVADLTGMDRGIEDPSYGSGNASNWTVITVLEVVDGGVGSNGNFKFSGMN